MSNTGFPGKINFLLALGVSAAISALCRNYSGFVPPAFRVCFGSVSSLFRHVKGEVKREDRQGREAGAMNAGTKDFYR
jgi:hypothetical protein